MKKLIVLSLLSLAIASDPVFAQLKYFEDSFNGGVTVAGYSPVYNGGGTGTITVSITSGSTIRQAYLLAGRHGNPANITVTLAGTNYTETAPTSFRAILRIATLRNATTALSLRPQPSE